MKRSAQVTLTVLAAVAGARAQQASNPCSPGSFNQKACHVAVRLHGYCDSATWVPQQYQKYPYYYDLYQAYTAGGGVVTAAPASTCRSVHGGFGAISAAHGSARS
jgi:hypothetical protein